jgi:hypothetical protein
MVAHGSFRVEISGPRDRQSQSEMLSCFEFGNFSGDA